jgi:hypothetical protein
VRSSDWTQAGPVVLSKMSPVAVWAHLQSIVSHEALYALPSCSVLAMYGAAVWNQDGVRHVRKDLWDETSQSAKAGSTTWFFTLS